MKNKYEKNLAQTRSGWDKVKPYICCENIRKCGKNSATTNYLTESTWHGKRMYIWLKHMEHLVCIIALDFISIYSCLRETNDLLNLCKRECHRHNIPNNYYRGQIATFITRNCLDAITTLGLNKMVEISRLLFELQQEVSTLSGNGLVTNRRYCFA